MLSPQTVEAMTARHVVDMADHTFGIRVDRGLGIVPEASWYERQTAPRVYGRSCSPQTIGHAGYMSSVGFADPECGLVVAWVCNGFPGMDRHLQRHFEINEAICEDMGLAC